MQMQRVIFRIKPLSAFATLLKGDTLFGQLCWAILNRKGDAELAALLDGYTEGRPFAVFSDAFPTGYVQKPTVPPWFFGEIKDASKRKALKKQIWMPVDDLALPLHEWQARCCQSGDLFPEPVKLDKCKKSKPNTKPWQRSGIQTHNTIHRLTGTTGEDAFAPYNVSQQWYRQGIELDCHAVIDVSRVDLSVIQQALKDIGNFGYGRDASTGAGKFSLNMIEQVDLPQHQSCNVCMTLAPVAPQGLGLDSSLSFYQLFTRFGRHGDNAVHRTAQPFKNPVLMAQTGAVFPWSGDQMFIGQGLGGGKQGQCLSMVVKETVQQAYAPVIPLHLSDELIEDLKSLEETA